MQCFPSFPDKKKVEFNDWFPEKLCTGPPRLVASITCPIAVVRASNNSQNSKGKLLI